MTAYANAAVLSAQVKHLAVPFGASIKLCTDVLVYRRGTFVTHTTEPAVLLRRNVPTCHSKVCSAPCTLLGRGLANGSSA